MKRVLKVFLLIAVFLVVAEVSELVVTLIPGTPNYRLERVLSAHRQAGMNEWLGSPEAASIIECASAVKYLVILPFASFVIGIIGARLAVARNKVAMLAAVLYACMIILGYVATFALSALLATFRSADGMPVSSAGHTSYLEVILLLAGLVTSWVTSWLGHMLGASVFREACMLMRERSDDQTDR